MSDVGMSDVADGRHLYCMYLFAHDATVLAHFFVSLLPYLLLFVCLNFSAAGMLLVGNCLWTDFLAWVSCVVYRRFSFSLADFMSWMCILDWLSFLTFVAHLT